MKNPTSPEGGRFDAIVIGSGYGGSVAAYRLSQTGLTVAVLETGYEQKAPNLPRGEASEWNPADGHFGPHTVTHLSKSVTAWHGTAVGGGSIVNAAVMIRKDEFENWPGGITRESLNPFYDLAERMLGASPYPINGVSPYATTTKTRIMLQAAKELGVPAVMPPVAITYRQSGEAIGTIKVNAYGAQQQGCRQCGECSLPGCNYQAKNSLDFNYLFGARQQFGAAILPGNKVEKIEELPEGGYLVSTSDAKTSASRAYQARIVVVAAGAVGSSRLLLRNKMLHKSLPRLSPRLGRQYTTNGTFIGFAVRSKHDMDPAGGPEITAGLDFKGPDGKSQGILMFDGSFRGFSYDTFFITGRLTRLPKWMIKVAAAGFNLAKKVRLVQPQTTLPLLVIGRDDAVGSFTLDRQGNLVTDLDPRANSSFYTRANLHMKAFTTAMGTRFLRFPLWSLQSKIDVPHNLGGVPMGDSAESGVVDDLGRVYGYDNLLVLDGSIIPATMGANPALTIAALAERSMATVLPQWQKEGVIRAQPVAPPVMPQARDLSQEFEALYCSVSQSAGPIPLPPALQGKTVLWTQGILARHMGNHSQHVLARLREMGLNVVHVPVNTDVATRENIELIKQHIGSLQPGEGILAGHSRGGIMSLDAYRQLSPEDKAKIARIILVQSPVNGSLLADFVLESGLKRVVPALTRVIFGNNLMDTVRELSTAGRESAQRALPPLTVEDRRKILTLRSTIAPKQSPSFDLMRAINARRGHESDGVTPYALSAIPGSADVTLKGFDHEQLVIQEPTLLKRLSRYRAHKYYQAGNVTEALLRLAYRQ